MASTTRKSFFKSIFIILGGTSIARMAMFIFRYMCMKEMSVENYGTLHLAISLFLMLIPLAHFCSGNALSKFLSEKPSDPDEKKALFISNALIIGLIGAFFAAIIMFLFLLQRGILSSLRVSVFFIIVIGFMIHSIIFILSGAYKGLFRMKEAAFLEGGIGLSKSIVFILFAVMGYVSLKTAFLSYAFAPLAPLLLMMASPFFIKKIKVNILRDYNPAVLQKIFAYSKDIALSTAVVTFFYFFQSWRLSWMSMDDVAIFGGAILFYSALQFIFVSYVVTIVPFASRHLSSGQRIRIPNKKFFFLFYILMLCLIGLLKWTTADQIMFKMAHLDPYIPSLPVLYILFLGAPFDLIFGSCSGILQGSGHTSDLLKITLKALLVNATTVMVLGSFGAIGVAGAQVLTYIFMSSLGHNKLKQLDLIQ